LIFFQADATWRSGSGSAGGIPPPFGSILRPEEAGEMDENAGGGDNGPFGPVAGQVLPGIG
jgi:hypothetical protein